MQEASTIDQIYARASERARASRERAAVSTADALAERRGCARRAGGPPVTHAGLMRHAERFGPECCDVTAAEAGFGLDDLTSVVEGLDRTHAARWRRDHPRGKVPPWRVGPAEAADHARALLGIVAEAG